METLTFQFFATARDNETDFCYPFGLAVDRNDNIFIADAGNGRVQVYHQSGYYLRTIVTEELKKEIRLFSQSGRDKGELFCPRDVAVTELGKVYVADSGNHRVQVFNSSGQFVQIIGRQGISAALLGNQGSGQGVFHTPCGVALSTDEDYIIVADRGNHRVQVFTAEGNFSHMFGSNGNLPGQMDEPWGIAVTADDFIVVADNRNNRLQVFTLDGDFVRVIEGEGDYMLNGPSGVAVSSDGSYIATSDTGNNRVVVFTLMGLYVDSHAGSITLPRGVVIDSMSRVIVADTANSHIQCLYWKA
ncbi:E3 ubiquitin-protein ligase TRIM71-like [Bolinopsis microptera]|uniref:E3 ubiquitin-protein ligase TRIM71-like n=1 Tax=Bolinopsis microptera TaxID=2820187 RepID=UPI00307A3792